MGFGNPYGDDYNEYILMDWAGKIAGLGVQIISLADTVGVATPSQISLALETLIPKYRDVEFGVHLHSRFENWQQKFEAAVRAGCRRFDGALKGIGGCPMAKDELVGNMNTELMVAYLKEHGSSLEINEEALARSLLLADEIFAVQ
jgi:hydroxymethylglutaryl-CoA lyase